MLNGIGFGGEKMVVLRVKKIIEKIILLIWSVLCEKLHKKAFRVQLQLSKSAIL